MDAIITRFDLQEHRRYEPITRFDLQEHRRYDEPIRPQYREVEVSFSFCVDSAADPYASILNALETWIDRMRSEHGINPEAGNPELQKAMVAFAKLGERRFTLEGQG